MKKLFYLFIPFIIITIFIGTAIIEGVKAVKEFLELLKD